MVSKTITINLAQKLKVKPGKVLGFLTTPLGSFVKKSHLLAEKKRFLKCKKVLSPIDGVLEKFDEETGKLIIKVSKVSNVSDVSKGEELKSDGKRVDQRFSVAGFGKAEGDLLDLKKDLTSKALKKEFSAKILVVKGLVLSEALFKANALGVVGIVVPRELTVEELGVRDTVFGKVSLAFLAKKIDYKKMLGKRVLVDGERGKIEISN